MCASKILHKSLQYRVYSFLDILDTFGPLFLAGLKTTTRKSPKINENSISGA